MNTRDETAISGGALVAWLILVALVCVAALGYGASGAKPVGANLAYEAAVNLPLAAIVAGGLHLLFRYRLPAWFGWVGFALLYASLMGASGMALSRQRVELRATASELKQTVAALQSAVASGTGVPSNLPTGPSGGTEAQKMGEVLKAMVNHALNQRRAYEQEMDALGWDRVVDAQRLRADTSFADTGAMIQKAKAIVTRYRDQTPEIFAKMRREIETSSLSASNKRDMLAGAEKSMPRSKTRAMEIWSLEEQILDEIEGLAKFLHTNRSTWQVEGGQYSFRRQAELDRFNGHLSKVKALTAQQEKMQSEGLKRSQEALSRLGE